MKNKLSVHPGSDIEIVRLIDTASDYMDASRSDATRRAYKSDWLDFMTWTTARQMTFLPADPQTLVLYLSDRASTHRPVTLRRRLTAIGVAHRLAGVASPHRHPAVVEVLKGISRTHTTAVKQVSPLLTNDLRRIIQTLPLNRQGVRDTAMLLIGLAGGFRRSEIVSLDVADVQFVEAGLVITLRHSKTDQEGMGVEIGIPYGSSRMTCPVRSLRTWLEASGLTTGPLFRRISRGDQVLDGRLTGNGLAKIIKRCCTHAGLDASAFGGHSLRSGLATQAAMSDVPLHSIMEQGRWTTVSTVTKYIRKGSLFKGNAAGSLGL